MKKRVADIILSTLVERGITDCFAVVGGGAMFLDNALLHNKDMKKYFNHHEQACAMAAEAYARASGRMALVCVTSGPGGTNTLTGVMGAWVDSIPMIIISGQVRYEISVPKTGLKLRTRGVQEFNITDTVKTMTKYSKMITDPLDIKIEINKAVDIALEGRKGPVWIDVPQDVQSQVIEEKKLKEYKRNKIGTPDSDCIEFVYKELESSKRPVFLVGAGVETSGSRDLFRKVLKQIKIPVVSSLNGSNTLYRDNDLCLGPIGSCGQRAANIVVQNSDLIISLGCSLGFSVTGFNQNDFAKKAKIVCIDIDDEEMKKPGLHIYKYIKCDVNSFLNSIIRKKKRFNSSNYWRNYCRELKNTFSPFEAAKGKKETERVCSYVFWEKYYKYAPEDAILVLGNNTAITSALQIGNKNRKQKIFTNYNCGSMGYDLPAAIGTCIALKKSVFLATGDGSVMMNIQELQTISYHNLPIKIMIFENDGYNAIKQTSKNFFNGEIIGCSKETGVSFPDFRKVAKAFDIEYIKCGRNKDVDACIKTLISSPKPMILEISELLDDPVIPKVMSRIGSDGKMMSPALHDMFPFLSVEYLNDLMISEKE